MTTTLARLGRPPYQPGDRRVEVRLLDGTRIVLRPMRRGDEAGIVDAFERLSEESRYRRFLTTVPRLTPALLGRLIDVDHVTHEAWVAIAPDDPGQPGVGLARYVRLRGEPHVAEPAVTVVDDYQGRGLGSMLLALIGDVALAAGVRAFRAYVSAENAPMLHILKRRGAHLDVEEPGVMRADIPLVASSARAN